jgi:protein TonB
VTDSVLLVRPALQHVPPLAVALAIILHAAIATMVWWISPLVVEEPQDEPVMVMFDSSPSNVGLQAPERAGPPAPSVAASPPPSPPTDPTERQQALAPPSPTASATSEPAPSLPLFEFSVPPVSEPPPPPTSRDFAKPSQPTRPAQRLPPLIRRPPAQQRPPTELPAIMPSPIPGPEPGDVLIGRGRQRNDYLSRVFRHLEPYRFNPDHRQHGRVVTRVTLARDGRVLDARIDTSSGSPALDAAELAAIRRGSPFPPLPREMPGDPVILVLPINY